MKTIKMVTAVLFTVFSMMSFVDAGGMSLLDKATEELSEKEKILLDILRHEKVKDSDFSSLLEVDGSYPDVYENAYTVYLDSVGGGRVTRRKHTKGVEDAASFLFARLFPEEALAIDASKVSKPVYNDKLVSLLIGIDYKGSDYELENCIHDVEHVMNRFLKPTLAVTDKEMIVMSDYKQGTDLYPTRRNILKQFDNFVERANVSKRAYMHYSGHGSYVRDTDGDEKDKRDEALCPIDSDYEGYIEDDIIYEYLVKALDADVKLTAVTDCCHSGTIMDLPYKWTVDGEYSFEQTTAPSSELKKLPNVVMISGCKDKQTSADGGQITGVSKGAGALTAAYLETLREYNYQITYRELLTKIRARLHDDGFDQVPQLSSTYKLNLDDYFITNGASLRP
ncbi:MAG: hypothetical protein S4CHLAM37_10960 [Chlamydiia bacterium]|nr:hypothetical protein [Chlamydiia bacterium]